MKQLLVRTTYLPKRLGAAPTSINTAELLALIIGLECLPPSHPRIYVQDSNTARNLYLYLRDRPPDVTPRQHIRTKLSTISKSLAHRLLRDLALHDDSLRSMDANPDPAIAHVLNTLPSPVPDPTKPPPLLDTHPNLPSLKVKSHQLTDTGLPNHGKAPAPCFSIAHANFWPDRICAKFASQITHTHTRPTIHCPRIPYPSLRYTLTLGPMEIDAATP